MTMYTVVNDGYDVDVYRTRKALLKAMSLRALYFADSDDGDTQIEVTPAGLTNALRRSTIVRLSIEPDDNDWTYRIESH